MARIPRAIIDEMIAHSRADLPNEACGMVHAVGGQPSQVHRVTNASASPYRYMMDPQQQLKLELERDRTGETLYAIYHSHVASEARPSPTDERMAFFPPGEFDRDPAYPDTLYILVSLAQEPPPVRAWRVYKRRNPSDERPVVEEEPIEIVRGRAVDHPPPLRIGARTFQWGARTYVMAVINATPDSFSGDGVLDPARAAEQARHMVANGADLLDIGAESTRPGHGVVDSAEEWQRLAPVLRAVRDAVAVPITVDSSKAAVVARAFEAGADALNDVQGLRGDPAMASLAARSGRPVVIMHNQRGRPQSSDVIAEVGAGLEASLRIARHAGIDEQRIIFDPGFGFGWQPEQNLEMLRGLADLRVMGRPLLLGTSRKSTLGVVLDRPEQQRQWGTAATVALAVQSGVDIVRVHDVREMAETARMADAVVRGWPPPERRVWLALGGNLGDRVAQLRAALDALVTGGVGIDLVSSVYETPPWGIEQQPRFANIAVAGHTMLPARDILAVAKRIEAAAGRDFSAPRNSARPIDVDILAIAGEQLDEPDLQVPHAALHERAFVLVPFAEVAPDWRHPRLDRSAQQLLADVDASGIEVLAKPGWWTPPRA